jgi:hypothetical protein
MIARRSPAGGLGVRGAALVAPYSRLFTTENTEDTEIGTPPPLCALCG